MLKLVFLFCTYLFAAYGFICMLASILNRLQYRTASSGARIDMVLLVQNAESIIEGIIRSVFIQQAVKNIIPAGKLYIMDTGSSDNTVEILNKIEKEYKFVQVVEGKEKDRVFAVFSQE